VNRRHTAASCEKDAQELARAIEAFAAKADSVEQAQRKYLGPGESTEMILSSVMNYALTFGYAA
jgi:hypothetical protein